MPTQFQPLFVLPYEVRASELEAVVKELEDQLAEQEAEAQNQPTNDSDA